MNRFHIWFFFFKQKTAYEIGTGDWSSDVCSSDLFIVACLLVPIIGFGLYPKLITQVYDTKTIQISERIRTELFAIAPDRTPPLPLATIPTTKTPAIGQ